MINIPAISNALIMVIIGLLWGHMLTERRESRKTRESIYEKIAVLIGPRFEGRDIDTIMKQAEYIELGLMLRLRYGEQTVRECETLIKWRFTAGADQINAEIDNRISDFKSFLESADRHKPKLLLNILVSIVLILVLVVINWQFDPAGKNARKIRDKDAKIAITDFYNWIKENDAGLKPALDSIAFSCSKRGVFGSGPYISAIINYAQNYRRKRDISIDSMLVRLRKFDIDTDTLKFKRKLPIRIGSVLKNSFDNVRIDKNAYGLDTL
jgi:hypothetical protein